MRVFSPLATIVRSLSKAAPLRTTSATAKLLILYASLGVSAFAAAAQPEFSEAERHWIERHPVIYFAGAVDIGPLEDIVGGEYVGLIPAFLDMVAQKSGLTFRLIPTKSWEEAQDAFDAGKADLFPNAAELTLRPKTASGVAYSQAYFSSPVILVTKGENSSTFNPLSLQDKRISIRGDEDLQQNIKKLFPGSEMVRVHSPEEGLNAVLSGRVEAAIGTEATLQPLLRRQYGRYLGTASMVAMLPYQSRMGIRITEPLLLSIINKSLGAITAHESDVIYERYLSQADYGAPTAWSILHYRRTELLSALAVILLLSFFAWQAHVDRRRASRSEASKASFLANMSHEIRTPINAIFGSIELLARTQLDSRQTELTLAATSSAEILIDLLDNVLDLSKLDAHRLLLEELPTDVTKLANELVQLSSVAANEKNVAINLEIYNEHSDLVVIDPTRLRQVLNNLISNAVKFTNRGCVNIDIWVAPLSSNEQTGTLEARITDTGIGIAPEQHSKLFNRYSQADASTTREYGGTGLGLTICKELVELMGGEIKMNSILGTGTSFNISIPVALVTQCAQAHVEKQDNVKQTGLERAGQVLVVDDHPSNQVLIYQQLVELGFSATVVGGGEAALMAISASDFDLVLMDCQMPGMNGYETTRRIRNSEQSRIPIIAISAATDSMHLEECLASGMDGILKKPLRLHQLRSTLALWLVDVRREVTARTADKDESSPKDYVSWQLADFTSLENAASNDDTSSATQFAHRIRGAALMHGDDATALAAQTIEERLVNNAPPTLAQLTNLHDLITANIKNPAHHKK